MNTHTISMLLRNEPGVLARVVVLFSSRDVEVESMSLDPTEPGGVAQMDVVVGLVEGRSVEQLMKQLRRLVDVEQVAELAGAPVAGGQG